MDLMKARANQKLKSRWYEPFSVSKDLKNGAIELYDEDGNEFIANKLWVKPCQKDVLEADNHSKWMEAQAFPTNDARNVVNFLKKLFIRFEIPKALISDRGTHFCNYQMERAIKRYGAIHRFSTAYHPQTNGQVKNINRAIKRILEKTIRSNTKEWSHKLDDAL
nr:putative reverse transcriptase domain-containing protein [Tanacetum cinerariifolium]